MAERISGLSISLDLETAQVDRGLSQIKRSFRSLQRSASVNMNNMKFDSKDITTYKKNLDALSQSYDSQKQNVDDIKKRMDQMSAAGKDNTEAFKDLNGEYNRQVDELNKLGHALEKAEDGLRGVYNESSRLRGVRDAFSGISNSLGNVGSSLQNVGGQMQGVGRGLTRSITTPALAAVSAIGGITAAFGWSRLVGLDSAQAQLKGLGYNTEEVGRISDQVTSAIEGGMTTMAEGTSIAAGAMAAGVEEGAELEKYIKLVGDAAVGANRPVGDMASIFNRVQGTGKLMTQELNMIEDGMPGFAMAMSESLGVSQEEFRKMVTDGEVTSEQFLNVMDDFAGGMATAYADSWQGMLANTKAYVGIIGENLLSGVFEQSKESIAEFIEFLKSDEVVEWAKTTGAAIGDAFSKIVQKVQEGITWFKNLDTEQQKLIGKLALVAVAAGPVLTVLGSITIFVGSVVSALSGMFGILASVTGGIMKFTGGLKMVSSGAQTLSQAFPKLGKVVGFVGKAFSGITGVFTRLGGFVVPLLSKGFTLVRIGLVALTGPVGIVIGVISALAAGFVFAYKKSETFRNFIDGLRDKFMQAIEWIKSFATAIKGIWSGDMFAADGAMDLLASLGLSQGQIELVFSVVNKIKDTFVTLKNRVQIAISAIGTVFSNVFNGIKSWWAANGPAIIGAITDTIERFRKFNAAVWNGVKTVFITVFNAVKSWWDSNGQAIIGGIVSTFNWLKETVGLALNLVLAIIKRVFKIGQGIFSIFSTVVSGIWKTLWNVLVEAVRIFAPIVQGIWNTLWSVIKNTIQTFAPIISGIVNTAINIITETFQTFKPIVLGIWNTLWPVVVNVIQGAWSRMKLIVGIGMDLIQGIIRTATALINGNWSTAWEAIRQTVSSIKDRIVGYISNMRTRAIELINRLTGGAIDKFTGMKDGTISRITEMYNSVVQWFQNLWNNVTTKVTSIKNSVVGKFTELKNGAINIIMNMVSPILQPFLRIYEGTARRMGQLRDIVVQLFRIMLAAVVAAVTTLYNKTVQIFTNVYNRIASIVTNVYNWVKNRFINLRDSVVNTITNLYNRASVIFTNVYNRVSSIVGRLRDWVVKRFNNLRDRVVTTITNLYNRASQIFTNIYNRVASIVQNLYNRVKSIFDRLYNTVRNIFNNVRNFVTRLWNNIRDRVANTANNLWTRVKNTFNNLKRGTQNIFNSVKTYLTNKWNEIKNSVTGVASDLWSGVKGTFNNMKEGLSNIIDEIVGFIDDMVDGVKKGLNKLIDGVNFVAGKIGMDPIDKIALSTGTTHDQTVNRTVKTTGDGALRNDTIATVGDRGPGNGPGGFRRELIQFPNGKTALTPPRDTQTILPRGSKVFNGRQTHAMMQGVKLSTGTAKENNGLWDGIASAAGRTTAKVMNKGKETVDAGKEIASDVGDALNDVWQFASNPGKLVDMVLKKFGVNFDFAKGDMLGGLMKGMYGKLKAGVKNLFTGWLEDSGGGDGSSFTGYRVTTPYSPNKAVPGYPKWANGGKHYGIDYATPTGTTLKAPNAGKVSKMNDKGGGTVAKLLSGKFTQFFMHLQSVLKTGQVKKGEAFAKTGNSGQWTTGAHLHYQVEKGDSPYVTNKNTVDPDKYLAGNGGGGGGSKKASAWRPQVVQALKGVGLPTSKAYQDAWIKQIDTESGGNAGITQSTAVRDINAMTGNLAQGLVQVIPPTFNAYKMPGHGNIMNGLDNLMAGMNYAKSRYGKSGMLSRIGKGMGYEKGGLLQKEGFFYGAEGDKEEMVIPLNRPTEAMKLMALAAKKIGGEGKSTSQLPNAPRNTGGSNDDLLAATIEQNGILMKMLEKLTGIEAKDLSIGDEEIGRSNDRYNQKKSTKHSLLGGRPSYV